MAITYCIDMERGVVFTTITGVLTDDEIVQHKQKLVRDPDFSPGMRQLSDVRGVERLDVTPDGVKHFAALDEEHTDELGDHRLAIVVSDNAVFGTARMYQAFTVRNVEQVSVFRSMNEAREWLGLPLEDD